MSSGEERESWSPLTVAGASIDVKIGVWPSKRDAVYEYGLEIGKHLSIGHFFGRPHELGRYIIGGVAFHIGIGVSTPVFSSKTLPDESLLAIPPSEELYFKNLENLSEICGQEKTP